MPQVTIQTDAESPQVQGKKLKLDIERMGDPNDVRGTGEFVVGAL